MSAACGKVILLGEHAVVYGTEALAISLDRGVTVNASSSRTHRLQIERWGVLVGADQSSDLARAFHKAIEVCQPVEPAHLCAEASIPAGAGLGCSAALGAAVARALLKERATPELVFDATQRWESEFHGTPSGIDAWAAQGIGLFRFARGHAPQCLEPTTQAHLLVCYSGERGNTKEMVRRIAERRARDASTEASIAEISTLVKKGADAIEAGDWHTLGAAMNDNHSELRKLGVSTDNLDRLCDALRKFGALGAKLTGSGGGGCALAVFATRAGANEAATHFATNYAPCFSFGTSDNLETQIA